jgi:murein DD-endopeptidase MepM/ murein hydrolase activator NlpD
MLALGFVTAVVVAVKAPDLFTEGADVGALRAELAAAQDSLAIMRASLSAVNAAESGDLAPEGPAPTSPPGSVTPAGIATPPVAAAPIAAPKAPVERPKPLRARTSRARAGGAEEGLLASMPRSISELPVIGALVSGFSRARRHPLLHVTRPHLGVDVAAPRGTRVSAPAPGRVRFVGRRIGFGLVVELDHGDGVTTRYAHLRSAAVEAGEQVTKGEAIAAVGTSGVTTGPHLHYEVLVHGRQVDPLRYRFAGAEPVPPAAPTATGGIAPATALPTAAGGAAVGTHEGLAPAPR